MRIETKAGKIYDFDPRLMGQTQFLVDILVESGIVKRLPEPMPKEISRKAVWKLTVLPAEPDRKYVEGSCKACGNLQLFERPTEQTLFVHCGGSERIPVDLLKRFKSSERIDAGDGFIAELTRSL